MNEPQQKNNDSSQEMKPASGDRRQHPRFPLYTAVTVLNSSRLSGMFWAKDLSLGGALLFGHARIKPGRQIQLLLHLPWYKPMVVDACVLRKQLSSRKRQYFAIHFKGMTRSAQLEIDQAIKAARQCTHRRRDPTVLLVTENAAVVSCLERHFHFAGIRWVLAQTPLDAVQWLQDWEVEIDTVIMDLAIEKFNVLTMLNFLSEEHQQVRRILIAEERRSTLERVAVSYGKIDTVLRAPMEDRALTAALQN